MNAERWHHIEDLFFAALEQEESARPGFLDVHCDGDADLRREVEGMLRAENKAAARLAGAVGGAVRSLTETISEGSRIGAYEILQTIGEGGMGVVYRARRSDDVFKKDVAIKIVKRGMLYELLTGSAAHDLHTVTPAAALRAVCEEEIRPPSQAARTTTDSGKPSAVAPEKLRGDLDGLF